MARAAAAGPLTEPECYYSLLGVGRDATQRDIERAWRQRALESHPDKAAEEHKEAAEERFKAIANAHEVLANAETRRLYDLHGHALKPPVLDGFAGPGGAHVFRGGADFQDEDLEALFEAMLRGQRRKEAPRRPEDVWDGVLGLGLVGVGLVLTWAVAPFLGRWALWARWQWRFFVHDVGHAFARA